MADLQQSVEPLPSHQLREQVVEGDPVDVATVFVDVEDEVVHRHCQGQRFAQYHVKEEKHKGFLVARSDAAADPTTGKATKRTLRAVVVHF